MSPYIRFEQEKKLHRLAVQVEKLAKGYDSQPLFEKLDLTIRAGERVAIVGPNGIGKSTLLRCLVGDLAPDAGTVDWAENADVGYMAQDHAEAFESDASLFEWMNAHGRPTDDDQAIRAVLGRLLFARDEISKAVRKVSGGEQGRLLFGELMLKRPNVIVMDEPTNHLDMESIESLNLALENYPGTLIFVSHDRQFVSSLATRIIALKPDGIVDFSGSYEDYLRSQGIDVDMRRATA